MPILSADLRFFKDGRGSEMAIIVPDRGWWTRAGAEGLVWPVVVIEGDVTHIPSIFRVSLEPGGLGASNM